MKEREDTVEMGTIIGEGITFDDVLLVPQYSEVGNAVPPLLAKAIATEIMRVLEV